MPHGRHTPNGEVAMRFSLEWEREENKFHLEKWSQVCKPKKERGLGIRPLKEMNLALLGKWPWRIGDDDHSLWKQVIFSKYDISRDGWLTRDPLTRFAALWRGILTVKEAFLR